MVESVALPLLFVVDHGPNSLEAMLSDLSRRARRECDRDPMKHLPEHQPERAAD